MAPDTKIEPDRPTLSAAEGMHALGVGDTALARQKYAEAGEILHKEARGARRQSDKMLLRFLAATQFYKGGDYARALEICKKIETRLIPERYRGQFPPFLKTVKQRASPRYRDGIDRALRKAYTEGDFRRVIDLFKDHPYVLSPAQMASLRATACEEIGEWKAAALFHESAIRFSSGNPDFVTSAAFLPLKLIRRNRLEEAGRFIHRQTHVSQHPAMLIAAAAVAFQEALSSSATQWQKVFDEQRRFIDQAWEAYKQLPAAKQNDSHLRCYVAFGLASAARAAIGLRDKKRAKQVLEWVNQLGDVAGSTQRTVGHLRAYLDSGKVPWGPDEDFTEWAASENRGAIEAIVDSEVRTTVHNLLPSLAV